jgi:uncharacterized protein (DUF885 family)
MGEPISTVVDDFLGHEFAENPTLATAMGVAGHDDRLGDLSAAGFARREAADDAFAGRFAASECTGADDEIDRDLALSTLAGRRVMRDWAAWRRSPDAYLGTGLQGVFLLFLHRLRPEAELAAAAAARLREVPRVLEEARANLEGGLADPLLVRRSMGQCQAGIRYARDLVPAEVADAASRRLLSEAGEEAAAAYTSFAAFLEGLEAGAQGTYAIGADRYTRLLRDKELLRFDAMTLRDLGRAQHEELSADMARRASDIAGSNDWRALLADLHRDHAETPEEMRAEYESWTERARRFSADEGLVTLPPGEECAVVPSPPFQRPVLAVASYNRPPAFTGSRRGFFFVPFPPDGTSAADITKRLEANNHHGIPSVAVHEAYPGHHWHLTAALDNDRPLRKVLTTPYFVEGWALYAEIMMREAGFFTDPRQEMCQVEMRLFRAARIVVDTSLHIGDMDVEEAVAYMRDNAALPEPTARAEVARYCAWPTQAASYLTGSLEIERIRSRWQGGLRQFHDRIARSGGLPIALAERATLDGAS